MIQIVDKEEVAKRKPYKFSYDVIKKMAMKRKEKEIRRIKIAISDSKINSFVEAI